MVNLFYNDMLSNISLYIMETKCGRTLTASIWELCLKFCLFFSNLFKDNISKCPTWSWVTIHEHLQGPFISLVHYLYQKGMKFIVVISLQNNVITLWINPPLVTLHFFFFAWYCCKIDIKHIIGHELCSDRCTV